MKQKEVPVGLNYNASLGINLEEKGCLLMDYKEGTFIKGALY